MQKPTNSEPKPAPDCSATTLERESSGVRCIGSCAGTRYPATAGAKGGLSRGIQDILETQIRHEQHGLIDLRRGRRSPGKQYFMSDASAAPRPQYSGRKWKTGKPCNSKVASPLVAPPFRAQPLAPSAGTLQSLTIGYIEMSRLREAAEDARRECEDRVHLIACAPRLWHNRGTGGGVDRADADKTRHMSAL